jgi:asparagine synthase (glutamine-hydrolysing)
MAICGYAIRRGEQALVPHESERMCRSLGPPGARIESVILSGAQLQATQSSFPSGVWSDDFLAIGYEANLYDSALAANQPIGEWLAGLYRTQGRRFLDCLRGDFSLALWDRNARSLLMAVDRLGVRTLCYVPTPFGIMFASQPRAFFASGRLTKAVNLNALTDYFVYNVVPIPASAFKGVTRVRPGECVTWYEKELSARKYWQMRYPENATVKVTDLCDQLRVHMEESVRLTSDQVNLNKAGCFLSGGTDSSSIVGWLTKLNRQPAKAFSIGFSEQRFNELEYARIAARHFGVHHVEALLGPDDIFSVIPRIVAGFDEPFGNSSALPTYWCARLAREHGIESMFAGDGGDELFGGNERYRKNEIFRAYHRIPQILRRGVIEPVTLTFAKHSRLLQKTSNYIRHATTPHPERYCQWRLLQKFSPEVVLDGAMPFRNGHADLLATIRGHYENAPATSELNRLLYVDLMMTLGDDDLPKVTRTAELAGINVRFPYLDYKLAEFTGQIPAGLKVRHFEKRYLFKLALRELLPEAILRKRKHGFGLPIGFWLQTNPKLHNWSKEVLFDPRTYQRGYFRRDFVEGLFAKMEHATTPYFGDLLWVFLMLELWHRQHMDGNLC